MSFGNWFACRTLLATCLVIAAALSCSAFSLGQEQPRVGFGQLPPSAGSNTGFGQLSGSNTGTTGQPQEIRQSNPNFLVRADVNHALRSYREGDTLSITVAAEVDAYLYVLYKQADGQIFQVFPNSTRSDNRVRAKQAVQIPDSEDLFRWVVGAPFGKETVKVLASKEPLTELSNPESRAKFFNPVSTNTLKGIQLELGKQSQAWAEDTIDINSYAAGDQQDRAGARRFGLFIGIGQYEYIQRTQKNEAGKSEQIYEPNHRDARTMAGVLQEVGRLNGQRLLTNSEATRNNVEQAITEWLPSVSRAGDTVILYFSGMAMPISQAAGVQADGIVLPLYDFMTANTLTALRKQREENKISTSHANQLKNAEQLVSAAGSSNEANIAVVRQWGITDDVFAHWLQGLAGRQIVVVLDAPYASAFGPQASGSSDPLAGGVARLGNLGQQEIVLLGACGGQMFDVLRSPQSLSLMTELLVQSLRDAGGALSVEEAYRAVAKKTEERLEEINQKLRAAGKDAISYRPYLVNKCVQPVYLKP